MRKPAYQENADYVMEPCKTVELPDTPISLSWDILNTLCMPSSPLAKMKDGALPDFVFQWKKLCFSSTFLWVPKRIWNDSKKPWACKSYGMDIYPNLLQCLESLLKTYHKSMENFIENRIRSIAIIGFDLSWMEMKNKSLRKQFYLSLRRKFYL